MSNETPDAAADGTSRRSFLKRGAAAAAGGYSVLQFDYVLDARGEPMGNTDLQDRGASALVFAWQFLPDVAFDLVTEIDEPEEILSDLDDDEGVPPIANPDEWDGFVIGYDTSTTYFGVAFFSDDADTDEGDRFRFTPTASLSSREFSLMDTDALVLQGADG